MQGHIEKRRKDSWTIIIDTGKNPVTQKRDRIAKSVKGPKREAEKVLNEMLYQLQTGTYVEVTNLTVAAYFKHWLETYCQPNLAPKTLNSYQSEINNHIIPRLGSVPLEKLSPLHLQSYYSQLLISGRKDGKGGLSARTILYHHRIIREALKHAYRWQLVNRNVADAVQPPRFKKKEMYVMSREDVLDFLDNIQNHRDYGIIYTAIFTGMRQGELLGLKWSNINQNRRYLDVKQQLQYLPKQGYIFKEPKTPKSKRRIPLTPGLIALLKEIKKQQAQDKLLQGSDYEDKDLVFCLENGKPLDPTNLTKRFKALVKKHCHPEMRWHDTRHTFAAIALASGITMERLQILLGHESITTTIDTYGHLSPATLREAMDKFSSFMGQ